jgi:hypothetical protein
MIISSRGSFLSPLVPFFLAFVSPLLLIDCVNQSDCQNVRDDKNLFGIIIKTGALLFMCRSPPFTELPDPRITLSDL